MQMFAIRREQDRLAEIAPLLKRFTDDHSDDSVWGPGLMLIWSDLGYEAQARESLERLSNTESSIPVDSKRLITLTYFAEVAARLCDREHAARIYELLLPFRSGRHRTSLYLIPRRGGTLSRHARWRPA